MQHSRPNVVIFITHDTGRFVSPYGHSTVQTPRCERLAAEGVRFANSFCTSPLCSPSRASIVTGRHTHQNGVMGLTGDATGAFDLYPSEKHAARLFADAGYASLLCGFEHETRDWRTAGFHAAIAGSGEWHNGGGDLLAYSSELDAWLESRDRNRPFYLQIGCHETHHSWTKDGTQPDSAKGVWVPPFLNDCEDVRREMAELQGAVKRLDTGLGMILDVFDRHGLADDTIFVFTTDHGIDVPRAKGTFYDPGIGVFHFMRYPAGNWGRGRVVNELMSNIDILPTLLEACGIAVPAPIVGRSFLPLLAGGAYTPNDCIFAGKTFHDTYDPTRAVRTSRYKYIRYFEVNIFQDLRLATETRRSYFKDGWRRTSVEEIYDLEADPWEATNLAGDPAHAEVLAALRRRLRDWMRATGDPLLRGPVESPFYAAQRAAFLAPLR